MEKVTVVVHPKLVRLISSPVGRISSVLFPIAFTFVPLFLFWLGQEGASFKNPLVWLCFFIIGAVALYHAVLADMVVIQVQLHQLRNREAASQQDS